MGVRRAKDADLETVVALHLAAFPGFFLTRLGPPFLRELYRGFLSSADSVFLVAEEQGSVNGFVVGSLEPEHFFKRLLLARWYAFVKAAFSPLLRSPMIVGRKLTGALFYRGEKPRYGHAALLSSLAVSPAVSRRGIGAALIEGFCDVAAQSGKEIVYLITDRDNNEIVNRFYLRSGFQIEVVIKRSGGRRMNRFVRKLGRSAASDLGHTS